MDSPKERDILSSDELLQLLQNAISCKFGTDVSDELLKLSTLSFSCFCNDEIKKHLISALEYSVQENDDYCRVALDILNNLLNYTTSRNYYFNSYQDIFYLLILNENPFVLESLFNGMSVLAKHQCGSFFYDVIDHLSPFIHMIIDNSLDGSLLFSVITFIWRFQFLNTSNSCKLFDTGVCDIHVTFIKVLRDNDETLRLLRRHISNSISGFQLLASTIECMIDSDVYYVGSLNLYIVCMYSLLNRNDMFFSFQEYYNLISLMQSLILKLCGYCDLEIPTKSGQMLQNLLEVLDESILRRNDDALTNTLFVIEKVYESNSLKLIISDNIELIASLIETTLENYQFIETFIGSQKDQIFRKVFSDLYEVLCSSIYCKNEHFKFKRLIN